MLRLELADIQDPVFFPVLCTLHEASTPMSLGHAKQILPTTRPGLGIYTEQALLAL